jgi:Ulp1 family protease
MEVEPTDLITTDDGEGTSTEEEPNGKEAAKPKTQSRAHIITIGVEDYERLVDLTEFLNDSLIDFWMRWYVL